VEREQMEAFLAVAQTRHFTRAAEMLRVAQTTVTARIKGLEERVGKPLFERNSRHVELSPAGRLLLPYVQRVMELIREGETVTRAYGRFADRLVVGSVYSLWDHVLYPAVERFRRQHPQTALRLITGHSNEVVKRMMDGVVDVAVLLVPPQQAEFEVEPLFSSTIHLVAHRDLGLGERTISAADLSELPFIYLDWGPPFDEWFAEQVGKQWLPAVQVDHASLFVKSLLAGTGMGFAMDKVVEEHLQSGVLETLHFQSEQPLPERTCYLVYPKRKAARQAVQAWIAGLREFQV
jgi:DNA-binding transcriptional LysR family regulator